MMWHQWKIFEKMAENLKYDLFWGPKLPRKWASEANIQHTSKSSSNWYVHQDWCGKFWKNDQRPEFLLILGPKVAHQLGLWGPNSPHIEKYLQWACEAILMWKEWKLFEKVTKHQHFYLLWGPKWPRNWAFDAHIEHISESSSNEHIKQDWCESRGNFLKENGPKIHTYKSSSNELVNQVSN